MEVESGAVDIIGDTVKLILKCEENGEVLSKQASPSIYMVPSRIRDLSPSSYNPTVVAIGPLQSKDEHLQEFEVQKTAYLHKWLHRLGMVREQTIQNCVEKVIHSIEGIKECYAGLMTYTDSELAKMMVIPQFQRPTIRMPKLHIYGSSELILRNLVVYEQSSDVGKYVIALDMLIDTPQDVALLIKSQVLRSAFGSNEEAADMINKLCKNIGGFFFYGQQWEEMDVYYNSYWPNTLAGLKRTYFNNPWSIIALIAAFVLFALTITQTITGIMAA
ncbi:hypothetical protein LXL04_038777 [Taraxacum kok-saghyz]